MFIVRKMVIERPMKIRGKELSVSSFRPKGQDGRVLRNFDLKSTLHACKYRDPCLIFGYNTAVFNILQRLKGIPMIINTDGIEWSRKRWGLPRQSILYINERISLVVGNHLIADHPVIETYLQRKAPSSKISMIAYGARLVRFCRQIGLRTLRA